MILTMNAQAQQMQLLEHADVDDFTHMLEEVR